MSEQSVTDIPVKDEGNCRSHVVQVLIHKIGLAYIPAHQVFNEHGIGFQTNHGAVYFDPLTDIFHLAVLVHELRSGMGRLGDALAFTETLINDYVHCFHHTNPFTS